MGIILEVQAAEPDLDRWISQPAISVSHRRRSVAGAERLWESARQLRLADTYLLGRMVRWRIPGVPASSSFDELFRNPPFTVLAEGDRLLVSGLVGKIWTLRRDYPVVGADGFREWSTPGTAKVVFATWVQSADGEATFLNSEARVQAFGAQGRLGLASVRPLVRGFEHLVGADALAAAVRRAERAN